jgi:hypothetical protein
MKPIDVIHAEHAAAWARHTRRRKLLIFLVIGYIPAGFLFGFLPGGFRWLGYPNLGGDLQYVLMSVWILAILFLTPGYWFWRCPRCDEYFYIKTHTERFVGSNFPRGSCRKCGLERPNKELPNTSEA